MAGFPIARWREILDERVSEATDAVLAVDGVIDVVVGGSVGRREPWPFSDIDLIPITARGAEAIEASLRRLKARMTHSWASTGWTHILDVGWLSFSDDEIREIAEESTAEFALRLSDSRWLHATDKAAGGRTVRNAGPAQTLVDRSTDVRFAPEVRAARFDAWIAIVNGRLGRAREALARGRVDDAVTTAQVAGPLAAAALEAWSQREGSMTRFASYFERVAVSRGAGELLAAIRQLSRSDPKAVTTEITHLPAWLETRIEMAYLGRREVGEDVTAEQNRRDHILLYLGAVGLPTPAEWILSGGLEPAAYIDHASHTAAQVETLMSQRRTSAQ